MWWCPSRRQRRRVGADCALRRWLAAGLGRPTCYVFPQFVTHAGASIGSAQRVAWYRSPACGIARRPSRACPAGMRHRAVRD